MILILNICIMNNFFVAIINSLKFSCYSLFCNVHQNVLLSAMRDLMQLLMI